MYWSCSQTSVFHDILKVWACNPDLGKIHIFVKRVFIAAGSRSLDILLPEWHTKNCLMLDSFDLSFGIFRFIDKILNLLLDSGQVVLQMLSPFMFCWGCIHPNMIFLILSAWASYFPQVPQEPSLKDHKIFSKKLGNKISHGLRVMVVLLLQIPNGPRRSYWQHDLV